MYSSPQDALREGEIRITDEVGFAAGLPNSHVQRIRLCQSLRLPMSGGSLSNRFTQSLRLGHQYIILDFSHGLYVPDAERMVELRGAMAHRYGKAGGTDDRIRYIADTDTDTTIGDDLVLFDLEFQPSVVRYRVFGQTAQQTTRELDTYRVATENCWKWAYTTLHRFVEAIPFNLVMPAGRSRLEILDQMERMRAAHQSWLRTMSQVMDKCSDSLETAVDPARRLWHGIIDEVLDARQKLVSLLKAIDDPQQILDALHHAYTAVAHYRESLVRAGVDVLNLLSRLALVIGNRQAFFSLLLGSLNTLPGLMTVLLIQLSLGIALDTADDLIGRWVGHAWHNWHGRIWLRASLAIMQGGFNGTTLLIRAAMVVVAPSWRSRQRRAIAQPAAAG